MASIEGNYKTLGKALSEEAAEAAATDEGARVKVLVAVDHSEGSFLALRWALDHLFPDENQNFGSLILLHAQLPFKHKAHHAEPAVFETQTVVESVKKDQERNAAMLLERAASECNQKHVISLFLPLHTHGQTLLGLPVVSRVQPRPLRSLGEVRVEAMTVEGEPKEVICEVAEQIRADMVVVGSRGLGTIKRAFLGSVSDYVAHHATCPVLIVKPPKRKHHHDLHTPTP